jgi:hypothetical protein
MFSDLDKDQAKQDHKTQSLIWPTSDIPLPANPLISIFFAGPLRVLLSFPEL